MEPDPQDPQAFDRLTARLANQRWCVYAKRPFGRAGHLLGYLGRYTHRVAIANSRLLDVQHDRVTFRTKNGQTQTLAPVEFLPRFLQHVLRDGFKKIRHFGLYAGHHRALLESARSQILGPGSAATAVARSSWAETLRVLTGRDVTRCPRCGSQLERLALPERAARAPPKVAA